MSDTNKKQKHAYVEAGRKIEDASSTAWSFLFLAVLGFIALIYVWIQGLPLETTFTTLLIATIVSLLVILIFVMISIRAFRDRKKYMLEETREDADVNRICHWFENHYSADAISHGVDEEDISIEELYYLRLENISRLLAEEFPELEESFCEYLQEKIYQMYFPE